MKGGSLVALTRPGVHWALENPGPFTIPSAELWKRGSVTLVHAWSKKAQSVCVRTRVQDPEGRKP